VTPKRPINADVPAEEKDEPKAPPVQESSAEKQETRELPKAEPEQPKAKAEPPKQEKPPPKRREPKPLAPKLLGALVVLALIIIIVAIVGSSGGKDESSSEGAPAPAPAASNGSNEEAASQTPEALGFPSFATNNTTRIGGSDPTSNAAAVALAVFPSTTPTQRPAAVTLVSEEDWTGAIAAAVLMAPPIRAPILFSRPNEVPQASEEAFTALDPQGAKTTNGDSAFQIGSVALPSGAKQTRVDSGDPASTAAQIATLRELLAGEPPSHLLIASSSSPDFAMPAAAWAARSGDPVLYADAKKLPAATAGVLKEHPKTPVYVLGPTTAISKDVFKEIGKLAKRVKRVAGKDPASNALALARFHDGSFGWNVNDPGHGFVLARSDSPANAAAASPLSASGTWGPLLLTEDAGTLPSVVRSYLLDVKPGYTTDPTRAFYNRVWLIGDQEAIDLNQQAEVNELAELAKIGGEP
jgi:ell wall binding domain 2 (CWB2)